MKSILALILPGNPTSNANRRYMKDGRRGFGFSYGLPAILGDADAETGLSTLLPDDAVTISTTPATLTKRMNYLTHAAATQVVYLPIVSGAVRDVWIIKNGANGATVNISASDSGNILKSGGAVAGTSATVATTATARFMSDGTSWYRVG